MITALSIALYLLKSLGLAVVAVFLATVFCFFLMTLGVPVWLLVIVWLFFVCGGVGAAFSD